MRTFFSKAFLIAGMLAMVACGGGGDGSKFEQPGAGGPNPPGGNTPTAATVNVLATSPSLQSAGTANVDISAFVKDANNAVVQGATVTFSADSGQLQVTKAVTDSSGLATATLSAGGDPSNRRVTINATTGTISGTVSVDVTGSQLNLQGPSAMALGQSGTFTLRALDSAGNGVSNRAVTVASARANTLSASTVTTDSAGNASFNMTIANTGVDTITATGLGVTSTLSVAVNSDSFSFTGPVANTEVLLGATQTLTLRWLSGGNPVVGQTVTFASTRGNVSAPTAVTDGGGFAAVTITSTNSGAAVVTASGSGGTAQLPIEFVATNASAIEVQPSVFQLAPSGESVLTATVRDPMGNLVKGKTVTFSLQDVTGGTLSTASAVSDSQGRAQSTYRAGLTTSAAGGVVVTAGVQGTAITDTTALTVAQAQLFLVVGTGNVLQTPTIVQYAIPYVVQVTDANGNGVANVPVSLRVLSTQYEKGVRQNSPGTQFPTVSAGVCADEDDNNNGVLDPNEDDNGSGRIEAGNIATVTPSNAVSDANGFVQISVVYPRDHARWLSVRLDVRAGVTGTEFVRSVNINLPGLLDDFDGPGSAPGMTSPFGVNGCGIAN